MDVRRASNHNQGYKPLNWVMGCASGVPTTEVEITITRVRFHFLVLLLFLFYFLLFKTEPDQLKYLKLCSWPLTTF